MKTRKYPRIPMKNISVDVYDGVGFFSGIISNFSRLGFCMTDLSKKINADFKIMTVVVTCHGKRFKMKATPKWSNKDNLIKSIGAEILDVPFDWTEFVMNFEPVYPSKMWTGIRI